MRKLVVLTVVAGVLSVFTVSVQPRLAQAQMAKPNVASKQAKGASGAADVAEPVAPAFDHTVFDALLRAHVKNGLVDYAAFKDNADFARYIASLKLANLSGFEEAERIAFWLNVYNAYTIQLIASHSETQSIRNINKTLGVFRLKGPWSEPFVLAAGRTLTLDDVEHRILRHDFSEPRVHFAMSFGAVSAPALRSEAYTGLQLDEQLDDQARTFLHAPAKNRVDTAMYTVFLSPVIARYRADFGESNQALGRFLAEYYPPGPERRFLTPKRPVPPVVAAVATTDSSKAPKPDTARASAQQRRNREYFYLRVVETPFDWSLNIQKRP